MGIIADPATRTFRPESLAWHNIMDAAAMPFPKKATYVGTGDLRKPR